MNDEIVKAVLETEVDEESKLNELIEKAQVSEKGVNALKAALRLLSGFKDEMPEKAIQMLSEAAGMGSEKTEEKASSKPAAPEKGCPEEDKKEMADKEVKKELGQPEGGGVDIEAKFEAIQKAHEAQVAALKEQNEKIEKALKGERDARELNEWVAKAEKDLSGISGQTPQELGATLKQLADVDPKLAEAQFTQLKAASDAVSKASIFKEYGVNPSAPAPSSTMDEIYAMADGIVEKSGYDSTREQAVAKALNTPKGKALYEQYLRDNPEQN